MRFLVGVMDSQGPSPTDTPRKVGKCNQIVGAGVWVQP